MARETYFPDRGDLVHLRLQPSAGREQTGPRYAIVLSPKLYNKASGLAICCPVTSKVKGHPFEVPVDGKIVKGVVLSDHFRSMDYRERDIAYVERASKTTLDDVTGFILDLVDPQSE